MSPPSPVKVERNVEEEEEEPPPPPAKVERKVKDEEESAPMSNVKAGGDGAHINIKVKSFTHEDVFFRINRYSKMQRLMDMYCDRQSIERYGFTFLERGRRIRGEKTPDEIGLEDGDVIVALLHQSGS